MDAHGQADKQLQEARTKIKLNVAYHTGFLHRGYRPRKFDEKCIDNLDETQPYCNRKNGRTLGLGGDDIVRYADVISGGR